MIRVVIRFYNRQGVLKIEQHGFFTSESELRRRVREIAAKHPTYTYTVSR